MSNNDGNKTGCLVVAGGLLFAVAVAAAIGFQYYKGQTGVGDAANGPGDAPAAVWPRPP